MPPHGSVGGEGGGAVAVGLDGIGVVGSAVAAPTDGRAEGAFGKKEETGICC